MREVRLLSPEDAAGYLGLGSRWSVYRLIRAGTLPAVKVAGKVRIDRVDLEAFVAQLKDGRSVSVQARVPAIIAVPHRLRPLPRRRPGKPEVRHVPLGAPAGASGVSVTFAPATGALRNACPNENVRGRQKPLGRLSDNAGDTHGL
jgi:excisionase family DNA binding protein